MKTLCIYRNLLKNPLVKALCNFQEDKNEENYALFCAELFKTQKSLNEYIYSLILYDENIFSEICAKREKPSREIYDAAIRDLKILNSVANIQSNDFAKNNLPKFNNTQKEWDINEICKFYNQNSAGIFARYKAFKFLKDGSLKPVLNFDTVKLSDLKQYNIQKKQLIENTLGFLNSLPYNNVLLYGDRGCGKSSSVKALINEYSQLRIIQVEKNTLFNLDTLLEKLASKNAKFIIFIDDLTFNENDDSFNSLKAVLEGSLTKQPNNIAIYATTNRRHLIKETFSARVGDEIHRGDTLDETASLSDRFGLIVTFVKPAKDKYLEIVKEIANERGIKIEEQKLFDLAERFALEKSGRSPRIARQFIDNLQARISLKLSL